MGAMSQRGIDIVRNHLAKLPPTESLTLEERRAQYDKAEHVFPMPADVAVDRVTAPSRPAEWLTPSSVRGRTAVLYLHGGGYVIGSPRSHRHLAAVTHLCGAGPADAYARRGFRLTAGQKCGDHDVARYLARVNAMKLEFARLAAAE